MHFAGVCGGERNCKLRILDCIETRKLVTSFCVSACGDDLEVHGSKRPLLQ
jgi:hypothetical protein